MASIYYIKGNYEKSLFYDTQAIKISPHEKVPYNHRGLTFLKIKEYQKAIDDFSTAIGLDSHPLDWNNRGTVYKVIGKIRNACKDWSMACELGRKVSCGYVQAECQGILELE